MERELLVRKIEKGVVVDHIPAGKALYVLNVLSPDSFAKVVIAQNVDSNKLGKKDIIKVEGEYLTSKEVDFISLIAPMATINIIEDWKVIEKRMVEVPKTIEGIFKCLNLSCPSNAEYEAEKTKFKIINASTVADLTLQCVYCKAHIYSETILNVLSSTNIWRGLVSREKIKKTFLDILLKKGALKIASSPKELFRLKSGRHSVYFINVGSLTDGESLAKLKWALASYIALLLEEGVLDDFDFIFGPAYKGINLATLACEGLSELYGINKRYLYDRKEEKLYGDTSADRVIIGADHFQKDQKILIIDDVTTTGLTKVESLEKLKLLGPHQVVGLVLIVDRQEKLGGAEKIDTKSAVDFIQNEVGIKVFSILDSTTIFKQVRDTLPFEIRQLWINYDERYGTNIQ